MRNTIRNVENMSLKKDNIWDKI